MKISSHIVKFKKMAIIFNETDVPHLKRVFDIFLSNFDKDEKLIRTVKFWKERIEQEEKDESLNENEKEIVKKVIDKVDEVKE